MSNHSLPRRPTIARPPRPVAGSTVRRAGCATTRSRHERFLVMQWAGVRRCRGAAMMWSCKTRSGEPQRKIRPPSFGWCARLGSTRAAFAGNDSSSPTAAALVGAAQVRRHPDGSRELASLVVRRQDRGHGVAGAVTDMLLADEPGPVSPLSTVATPSTSGPGTSTRWTRHASHRRCGPSCVSAEWSQELARCCSVGEFASSRCGGHPATRTDDPPPCGHSASPCSRTNP